MISFFLISDNHKKYLTAEENNDLTKEPIPLEPWDPMGTLAD